MITNQKLRAEADRRRDEFFQAASSMSERMRPASVLDTVVGVMDPDFEVLKRFQSIAKRHPFAVLAAVGGLWFFARQLKRRDRPTKPVTRLGPRPHHLT